MIVGTAGHIDHGKTALVKALTGVDADRLPEEKLRGITLDLGYAYVPVVGSESFGSGDSGEVLGFVDVPGHERLIHNMLAGATGIDLVLLVIAADDGPMPQTREHLQIVDLLGIARGAVVLSKIDAVSAERLQDVHGEVDALLAGSSLEGAPMFAVSSKTGEGVAALRTFLDAQALRGDRRREDGEGFRLAIDRCFSLPGVGTVVTGTVFSGSVKVNDTLHISPGGYQARVRGLHAQDRVAQQGGVGQRCALNLTGNFAREQISRGQWALVPNLATPVSRIAVKLQLFAGEVHALKHWTPVHVHLGAADVTGRVALLEGEALAPGASMFAELLLDREIACVLGDRFIVRDASASRTLGGGCVLDLSPPNRHKRSALRLEGLQLAAEGDCRGSLLHALRNTPAGVVLDRFVAAWNLPVDMATRLWLEMALVVVEARECRLGFSPEVWLELSERLIAALAAEHERAPDMRGAERECLRRLTLPTLPRSAFDRLIDEALAAGNIAQTSSWLHLPGHQVTLSPSDGHLWQSLSPRLAAEPFQPPRVRDIAKATGVAEDTVRALFKRVARTGQLYPVALDHYFSAEAVSDLAGIVAVLQEIHGAARASDLRDRIGGGRKVAIHILEFFDRIGYTRRVRDEHVLRVPEARREWLSG
jgi:selenocysteine-specific elongation factor